MIKVISDGPRSMVEIEHYTQQEAKNEFRSLGYAIAYKLNDDQRNSVLNALAEGLIEGHALKQKKEREEKEECQKSKHLA